MWRGINTEPISVYEHRWHIFGAKSSPTCVNYALQQVGRDCGGMVASLTNRNFYMDDFVKSVASGKEAVQVYKNLRKFLADGGFQQTKWICNSENLMEEIPSEDRSVALSKTLEAEPLAPSILGVQWNVESDSLEICRVRENRCLPRSLRELFYLTYSLCLTRWECFPLSLSGWDSCSKEFGRNMGNLGTTRYLQKTR